MNLLTSNRLTQRVPFFARFLFRLYAIGIIVFMALRLVLFFYVSDDKTHLFNTVTLKAFFIGFQFDSVALAYVLAPPLLLLYLHSVIATRQTVIPRIVTFFLVFAYCLLLFITIADIPYYKFFNNRLSEASLQWISNFDIMLEMIVANRTNLFILALAAISVAACAYLVITDSRKQFSRALAQMEPGRFRWSSFGFFLLLSFFCFLGMRGTIAHPIRSGDAFYCENALLNQLGLNPAFTLFTSYSGKVALVDDKLAIQDTRKILEINVSLAVSPIARTVIKNGPAQKYNVVLVLMESMSANYMASFGNKDKLTPTLDSLAGASWFFTHAYSAGIHTNNGIFSSLFSFPALRRIRPMTAIPINTYSGIPFVLKQNGYRNMFFSTHDESFDNLEGFIPYNFFDELYTQEDYPSKVLKGPYGAPDDFLFNYAANKFNAADPSQPFFATILTTSNHDPYVLPDYFKSDLTQKDLRAVSYADWSIKQFLTRAKASKWYNNTVFVFVADHGIRVGENPYDMALSYNHVPLIIHAPALLGKPQVLDNLVGQIDIFPTLMGLLNIGFTNNTLGTDVLDKKRECIYFSCDDKLGCLNHEWLYVYRFGGEESLYRYKTGDTKNYASEQKELFEKLRTHALSQTQTAEWMITNNKTSLQKVNH